MKSLHLDSRVLEMLAAGRRDPYVRRLVRHLAQSCSTCRAQVEAAGLLLRYGRRTR
ncbi:MAG: hypothetical protein K0U98_11965 [Deltaproteobacteria bacterium]|nr:hypothetical protein [Deltaproteobacteria bacterium]